MCSDPSTGQVWKKILFTGFDKNRPRQSPQLALIDFWQSKINLAIWEKKERLTGWDMTVLHQINNKLTISVSLLEQLGPGNSDENCTEF